jgi:ferritin-like metal-binding protein YciE
MPKNKLTAFRDLFILKLNSLLEVENTLVKALPKMAENSGSQDLEAAFTEHLEKTKVHADRLKKAFETLDEKPRKAGVDAIDGLVSDAEWLIDNIDDPRLLDAALIAAAQYVEHYEIAGYTTAIEWAEILEESDVKNMLQETLDEEKEASESLEELATSDINGAASRSEDLSEDDGESD